MRTGDSSSGDTNDIIPAYDNWAASTLAQACFTVFMWTGFYLYEDWGVVLCEDCDN